jgi:hypothetical protein
LLKINLVPTPCEAYKRRKVAARDNHYPLIDFMIKDEKIVN